MKQPIIAIVGPTASGKTARAVSLARLLDAEIISGDSRQVYRGMDLGTGKDLDEYGEIPYHLIDICDAGTKYNLFRYLADASAACDDIIGRKKTPLICGGTGLYIERFLNGTALPEVPENPELRASLAGKSIEELTEILSLMKTLHNVTDIDTAKRAIRAIEIQAYYIDHPDLAEGVSGNRPRNAVVIGVDINRESRRRRITQRLRQRLDAGMIDEVKRLLNNGIDPEALIYYGLEYKFLTLHVLGQISRDEMFSQLEMAIHQFAKRQMTWFRGMEKRGTTIHWLPYDLTDEEFNRRAIEIIENREK